MVQFTKNAHTKYKHANMQNFAHYHKLLILAKRPSIAVLHFAKICKMQVIKCFSNPSNFTA